MVEEVGEEAWFWVYFKIRATRFVEREGKVGTNCVVKVFGVSSWNGELSFPETEAGLGEG